MMDQLVELESTFLEEFEAAQILKQHQKQKSVTILLSKALFALADYLIFQEFEKLPKNHGERFRILKQKFPELYSIIDEIWSKYTDSYNKPAQEKSIQMMEDAIYDIIKNNQDVSEKIKQILKKS